MQDYQAVKSARASVAAALAAANPHLVPVSAECHSLKAAAKNMRIELKAAFPGVKFSVRSSRFSGGDSIGVSWIDGPNCAQVDAIIDRYSGGSFNSSEDIYEYSRSAWCDAFGDAKYIHSSRDLSDKAIEAAIRTVKAQFAFEIEERGIKEISVADYRAGRLWNVSIFESGEMGYWSAQEVIRRAAYKRTWAFGKSSAKAQEAAEV